MLTVPLITSSSCKFTPKELHSDLAFKAGSNNRRRLYLASGQEYVILGRH